MRKTIGIIVHRKLGIIATLGLVFAVTIGSLQILDSNDAEAGTATRADCAGGYFCLWGDPNMAGRFIGWLQDENGNVNVPNIGDWMNDLASSVWNRTAHKVCVYLDTGYRNQMACFEPNEWVESVKSYQHDRISSVKTAMPCEDGSVCLWKSPNMKGDGFSEKQREDGQVFVGSFEDHFDNTITSIWNRTALRVCFYEHPNFQKELKCLNPGESIADLELSADEKISSFQTAMGEALAQPDNLPRLPTQN